MRLLASLHERGIHKRRIQRIVDAIAMLFPSDATVLDVGSGDGQLAQQLQSRRPDLAVTCVDTVVRADTACPVLGFDGRNLPFEPMSFDYVMMIDVLHHVDDRDALLDECRRVAAKGMVIKDHVCESTFDWLTLSAMDWAGNACHGISRIYRYFSRDEWHAVASRLDGEWSRWNSALGLYHPAISWLGDRRLHFAGRLDWRAPRSHGDQ